MVKRRSIFGLFATLSATALLARTRLSAQSTIGLAERCAIAAYQAEKYPARPCCIGRPPG